MKVYLRKEVDNMSKNYEAKPVTIKAYIKEALRMLKEDFLIKLTDEEIQHMKSLKRESDVDHYKHDIIDKYL